MILPKAIIHRTLQNTATQNKTSTKMILVHLTCGPNYETNIDKYECYVQAQVEIQFLVGYLQYPESSFLGTIVIDQVCPPLPESFLRFYVQPSLRHKYLESIKAALRHFMTL